MLPIMYFTIDKLYHIFLLQFSANLEEKKEKGKCNLPTVLKWRK